MWYARARTDILRVEFMFKIYGYESSDSEEIIELNSVSICGNAQAFRQLASFFQRCADEMELETSWDHLHFLDSPEGDGIEGVDLVAAKLLS